MLVPADAKYPEEVTTIPATADPKAVEFVSSEGKIDVSDVATDSAGRVLEATAVTLSAIEVLVPSK